MSLGRQEAFEIFKRDHADSITIEDNKQILKQRFSEAKALGESINKARSKVGHLKEEIVQRHMQQVALGISENTTVSPVPDPVEEKLRAQLEKEKKSYKTDFMHLKALKVEIEHLQLLMDKTKVKLQKEFEDWWAEETTRLQVNPPAANSFSYMRSCPQTPDFQSRGSRPPSHRRNHSRQSSSSPLFPCPASFSSDTSARRPLPSPGPVLPSPEPGRRHVSLTDSLPERPPSSIPLTGDSQTDSDILAFIRARQSILQRKCLGSN